MCTAWQVDVPWGLVRRQGQAPAVKQGMLVVPCVTPCCRGPSEALNACNGCIGQLLVLLHTPTHLNFAPSIYCCRGPSEALNAWSGSIGKLLALVEKTCQQIQKESMVHRVPIGTA